MKKVVVLGSTGMAGHIIAEYMGQKGFDVYRVSRSERNTEKSRGIDVINIDKLLIYLDEVCPDVVINCIGLLQKGCEEHPDAAVLINAYLPHCLENHYQNSNTKIIHLSTDCVFSGERGNYNENDLRDGASFYDRSKALGEICNTKDLTFRMSIIGPDIDENGTGLFNWFMKQNGTIKGYSKAIWNGVTTLELAEAIVAAIDENLCGLYHLVPEESINKYDLLKLFQKTFGKTNVIIEREEQVVLDKSLVNNRTDFSYKVKSYPVQIEYMKKWIEANKDLYPLYYN